MISKNYSPRWDVRSSHTRVIKFKLHTTLRHIIKILEYLHVVWRKRINTFERKKNTDIATLDVNTLFARGHDAGNKREENRFRNHVESNQITWSVSQIFFRPAADNAIARDNGLGNEYVSLVFWVTKSSQPRDQTTLWRMALDNRFIRDRLPRGATRRRRTDFD